MGEFLLEIRSEEIPARMQARAAEDLRRLVCEGIKTAGVTFDAARAFVTPRRLTLVVEGLPAAAPDVSEERRGPRVGAPDAALDGFLKSAGLARDQLERRDTGKGEFWFAVIDRKGRPTRDVLTESVEAVLAGFPWPKSMRWGSHTVRWVRPIRSLLCLFDGQVVPVVFGPVAAGDVTAGHRFLAPEPFAVTDYADYARRLTEAKVILDPVERRHAILSQAEAAAAAAGCRLRADDGLLDEVTGLVEWPMVLTGAIDPRFMAVPAEALTTAMRAHQKYFSLIAADGALAPRFLVVSDRAEDKSGAIRSGNERVLRARLSDAAFFWDLDRRTKLADRLPGLAGRLFYAGLGTMRDKAARMAVLARHLTFSVEGAHAAEAARAAELAKADLSSEMVGEFPELQGVMGRYYALADGESPQVAQAIAEHYAPQGPSDAVPTRPLSLCVALADKIDTLVGFFAIGEKPTGSKDPFALRRAALGVIRLIVENRLRLPLIPFLRLAHAQFSGEVADSDTTTRELLEFLGERLKVHLKERGVRHDLIAAAFSQGEDDLVRLLAKVAALADFLASDDGANLLIAYRRAANIVRIEDKKDGADRNGDVDPALLGEAEESALAEALATARAAAAQAVTAERYADAMAALARLRRPVDAFFDAITVNAEDPALRANRLALLAGIGAIMETVVDFSRIEG
jgi:glycyl-tRNA synthetase beta chain